MARANEPPVVLVNWYHLTKWLLARIESFPKSQRFVFGQRLADRTLGVMETLVEAAYSPAGRHKANLLAYANRELEVLRWLLRMAQERALLTARQCRFASLALEECGRMLGGWLKQTGGRAGANTSPEGPRPHAPASELRLVQHAVDHYPDASLQGRRDHGRGRVMGMGGVPCGMILLA
jgi:hypothetical protein